MAADDYAVVVGIGRYPGITPLDGPVNDARNFSAWLIRSEAEGGGGVPPARVRQVLSSDFPEGGPPLRAEPMLDTVVTRFSETIEEVLATPQRSGRRLYIYMAGHGFAPTPEESALLMANANGAWNLPHVAGRILAEWFRLYPLFREIALFMDCCRDIQAGIQAQPAPWPLPPILDPTGADVKRFYAFATKWSRKSRERLNDAAGEVQGLFTRALLAGLNGRACENGRITGTSLRNYVYNQLPELCKPDPPQDPEIEPADDLLFVANCPADAAPPQTRVQIRFRRADAGQTVFLVDGALRPVAAAGAHRVADGPWELTLPAGLYQVGVQNTEQWSDPFRVIGAEVTYEFAN